MAETPEEKPQARGENIPQAQPPQNETYFPHAQQLQKKETEESEEIEDRRGEPENKLNELLRAVNDEASQLTQFLAEEKDLTNELCSLLTQILKRLRIAFNIPPEYLAKIDDAKHIKLNTEGHLIIIRSGNKIDSKLLRDYSPEVILAVMLSIIPELEKAIKTHRKNISQRVTILEKIKQELKSLQEAFSPDAKESFEQLHGEEIGTPVITSEG